MENTLESYPKTVIISTCIFCFILWWTSQRKKGHRLLKNVGIPGPKPSLIMGNLTMFIKDSVNCWSKLLNEYGDICSFYLGPRPQILTCNLQIIQNVFVTESANFRNRPKYVMEQIKPLSDGLLVLRDDRWKISRKTLSPTFSAAKMKLMLPLMEKPIETFLAKMEKFSKTGEPMDMYFDTEALTLEVIGRCAFGTNVNFQTNLTDPFFTAVCDFMKFTRNHVVHFGLVFPGLEDLALAFNKHCMPAGGQMNEAVKKLKQIIKYRRANPNENVKDLLQLIIDACPDDNEKQKLNDEEVVGNAFSLLVAGFETTAASLGYTFYLLAKNPDIQEQLYQHIMEEVEGDPTYDDIMFRLPYLNQVFSESLRYYPPVVVFTNRECSETCVINGQCIPKGCGICVAVHHIHHDPKYWPNPEVFDPDRFSPENKRNIVPLSYMPFGLGPRNCIGMRFAQLEAKTTLFKAIRKFKFEFCDKTEDPLELKIPNVVLCPVNGILLKIIKR